MHKAIILAAALALTPLASAMSQEGTMQEGRIPLNMSPTIIFEVQGALSRMGYNPGVANGVWKPETFAALQAFQQANGMQPTGNIDFITLRTLRIPRRVLRSAIGEQVMARQAQQEQAVTGAYGQGMTGAYGSAPRGYGQGMGGAYGSQPGAYNPSMQQQPSPSMQQPYGYQGGGFGQPQNYGAGSQVYGQQQHYGPQSQQQGYQGQ